MLSNKFPGHYDGALPAARNKVNKDQSNPKINEAITKYIYHFHILTKTEEVAEMKLAE